MKKIVTTCKGREFCVNQLRVQIPDLIVNLDDFTDTGIFKSTAYFNYLRSFELAGHSEAIFMDDDIRLCDSFIEKAKGEIAKDPGAIITFFSMKKADLEKGTRLMPPNTFIGMCCFYLPPGYAKQLSKYGKNWYHNYANDIKAGWIQLHKFCPLEIMMQDWMKSKRMSYKIVVPNLVQHLGIKSAINPKRNPGRYSPTYI